MPTGRIPLADLPGGIDLEATIESGQSYRWHRADGEMYTADAPQSPWYWTTVRVDGCPELLRVRQQADALEWEGTVVAEPHLRRLLRLDDDLPAVRAASPDDDVVQDAYDAYWGMRLVQDPPFDALICFICSAQMRVARIHEMQWALREAFGEPVSYDGETYPAYPTPVALAAASESALRDLGLGYRAPYVTETASMVVAGEGDPAAAREFPYEEAREYLTQFVGVGDKVADCVLLFSLGFLEAVPLDTWMQTTIADYYPDCDKDSYAETSRAIRGAFGGEYAGYAQTYLFHYLRNGGESDPATT
jgi:N-glycosylase/DNA lyase